LLFNLLVSFVFFLFLLITTTDRTIWPGIISPGENRVARGNRTQEKKGKFGKLWESCHLFYYLFILFLNGRWYGRNLGALCHFCPKEIV
jgi:hypothetical protein